MNKMTRYTRKRRAAHKAKGLCGDCDNKPAPGRTLCEMCLAKRRMGEQSRMSKRALRNVGDFNYQRILRKVLG